MTSQLTEIALRFRFWVLIDRAHVSLERAFRDVPTYASHTSDRLIPHPAFFFCLHCGINSPLASGCRGSAPGDRQF